jgi:hypothetical protein
MFCRIQWLFLVALVLGIYGTWMLHLLNTVQNEWKEKERIYLEKISQADQDFERKHEKLVQVRFIIPTNIKLKTTLELFS